MLTDEMYVLELLEHGERDRALVNLRSETPFASALRRALVVWDDEIEAACEEVREEMQQQIEEAQDDAQVRESELDDREEDLDELADELAAREKELEAWERRLKAAHCAGCGNKGCSGVALPE